jgi:sulfite exporter TauE/SafE
MIGYGITYAVASLSCTIGPFLAVTGAALTASPTEAAATYAAYAVGMGVIILALSIAAALAHTTIAHHLRRVTHVAPRVGGILMILAGLYAVWYGRWELAVYDGDLTSDPVINRIENIRLWIVAGILRIGAGQLVLVVTAVAIATVVFVGRHRRLSPEAAQPGGTRERPAA